MKGFAAGLSKLKPTKASGLATAHLAQTHSPQARRKSSSLEISVAETKERMACAKQDFTTEPGALDSEVVESVESFRYGGTAPDDQLSYKTPPTF